MQIISKRIGPRIIPDGAWYRRDPGKWGRDPHSADFLCYTRTMNTGSHAGLDLMKGFHLDSTLVSHSRIQHMIGGLTPFGPHGHGPGGAPSLTGVWRSFHVLWIEFSLL